METSIDRSQLVAIREGREADLPFIYSSWLKGLRYGNSWFNLIDQDIYFKTYHAVIDRLLNTPGVLVRVACLKDDADVILGFSVFSGTKLHWVFCKDRWRHIGLAKLLVPTNIDTVTHVTKTGVGLLEKRKHIKFNPFVLT